MALQHDTFGIMWPFIASESTCQGALLPGDLRALLREGSREPQTSKQTYLAKTFRGERYLLADKCIQHVWAFAKKGRNFCPKASVLGAGCCSFPRRPGPVADDSMNAPARSYNLQTPSAHATQLLAVV